jgi:hypothetical protein
MKALIETMERYWHPPFKRWKNDDWDAMSRQEFEK